MSPLAIAALVILAAIATVLVVIAAVHLGRQKGRTADHASPGRRPRWFELLLALLLLAFLVALAVAVALEPGPDSAGIGGWRTELRSGVFLGVMLAAAALALVFLVVFLVARVAPGPASGASAAPSGAGAGEGAASVESPAGVRLLGLLLLALGVLVLGWSWLEPPEKAVLVLRVLYPASIAVALVLLFDKATRSWTPKGSAEGFREWLLCDLIVIGLILGFLNLEHFEDRDAYRAFFWDVVHIAAFFLVFWLLDRTQFRGRFLVATGYLALLPLLLLLWRWLHELEAPAELSWWSTVWPTFFLGLAFFVLEIISLIALRGGRSHLAPAIKDAVFAALYAILLFAAIPAAA